jgi:hypothetical protein
MMGFIKKYLYDPDLWKTEYDNITRKDVETVIKESIITNDTSWINYETNQQKEVKRYAFKKVVDSGLEAVPSLYKLLKDSDPKVRYSAIEALLEINTNENINDPKFYTPIIKLKYDPDDSIRCAAELAEVFRDNLILFKQDDEDNTVDNTFSSDDDTIFPTNESYDKKPRKKRFSDQLIDENDEYMDDIIAGLHKQ